MIKTAALALCLAVGFAAHAVADPIRDQVKVLSGIFLNGQVIKTRTQDPEKMIWRYLYVTYLAEDVKETEFLKMHNDMPTDDHKAGTLKPEAAVKNVMECIDYMLETVSNMEESPYPASVKPADMKQFKARAREAMSKLLKLGCTFGFDARRQNEGPTPYLLICDPKGRAVYGMELTPSEF